MTRSAAPDAAVPVPAPLPLTGVRTVPGVADETYWFQRHVIVYRLAADLVRAGGHHTVLDAGCGEGYGLTMLAEAGASRVVGVDLHAATVAPAKATYAAIQPAIEVHRAELRELPLADDEVELAVSLQRIEHPHDTPGYPAELVRVTRPGGTAIIATPNRLTFTPDSDVPVNPFHTREFTAEELASELTTAGLEVTGLVGVHHGWRLRVIERLLGRPLPSVLAEVAPESWPRWLRALVHRVDVDGFALHPDGPQQLDSSAPRARGDSSLDLLALARVPRR